MPRRLFTEDEADEIRAAGEAIEMASDGVDSFVSIFDRFSVRCAVLTQQPFVAGGTSLVSQTDQHFPGRAV